MGCLDLRCFERIFYDEHDAKKYDYRGVKHVTDIDGWSLRCS